MDRLLPLLSAWRVMRLGSREVVDALVRPEHRGGSPELQPILAAWPGRWYWADGERSRLVVTVVTPHRPHHSRHLVR